MPPAVTGHTRILAVVADPVSQARTPGMANAMLERRGLAADWVLVPLHVAADGFADFVAGIRTIRNFDGAVVSMPHKIVVASLVDELTPAARLAGAVNVIRRSNDGRLTGTLLDGEGFVAGLQTRGHAVRGARVVMAGAGGAAAAIAFALGQHGASSLCLSNRSAAKAEALATRVRAACPGFSVTTETNTTSRYDMAINATPLGMRDGDPLPFSESLIERSALVAECVLAPERTRLLEAAASHGKATHTGVPMLEAQMALMLEFFGVGESGSAGAERRERHE
jgi:shikimate dehydrogenase